MDRRTQERNWSEPWPGASVEFVATATAPSLRVARIGHGEPLLLINGLGANLEMWGPLVGELAGRREVVAFDLPGTGRSARPRLPLRMPQLARVVTDLLDELGYEQLDVLGYSLGGIVAQELARRAPERIHRLVLCATTPGWPSIPPDPIVTTLMLTPARYWNRRLAEMIVPIIAGGRTARDPRVLHAGLQQRLVQPPSAVGYLYQLYALSGWSSHPWIRRLQHPALVLHGERDPVVPVVNGRYLADSLPHGRLHVVEGAGHLFLLDEPSSVTPALEAFLSLP
jgi:poly(3-hydroxyoctanoate) depolymerase